MLLSVDWDYYSGSVEHTFDAPLWGTRDREPDRVAAWRERACRRDPHAGDWAALATDFPLYGTPDELLRYRGVPAFVAWSHAHAWAWLEAHPGLDVLNLDSHHDLYSRSGDAGRVRPGNWAGLGLARGLIGTYTCAYPAWHAGLRVAEGFDLDRTRAELNGHVAPDVLGRVSLTRGAPLPAPRDVVSVLLVQSPAWTNPAHDLQFHALASALNARPLSEPLLRPWPA